MGTTYGTQIVIEGLETYLDFSNIKSYSGTGLSILDISGNGNHATSFNTPIIDSTVNGNMVFNGTSDYINLANTLIQESSANVYTIILGVKLSSITTARRQLLSSDNAGYDWSIGSGDSSKFIMFTGESALVSTKDQDTDWHIIVAQWTSTGTILLIDNEIVGTSSVGYDTSISAITAIGRNPVYAGGSEYWHGNIAFMQKYNRVLSTLELNQNFEALRGRFGI